ncbi:Schizosaccharomyces pombe specific protein [Schizosaccharomyces pombe]|uniref:Uncharacterized protein C83.19c n=1 Tax=Schizosaccharomyces pombe (strain 972 / ATCC 24843) TaxID=284812 RepID=YG1J_SCHPO|nr:uncharacterized protein SPBC83.19c [Schizosaccharomyces pombe]Q9C0W4.1 RecName: Full=Uncharacterized protein C83.19c [Schizosaccharomyces pombe 972h-]CAC34985.1 sequence orphan [Schizosaccharomyces pombe]|eukprot:NP_595649.1 uncharacterized protein SPBC83.19c [Schizosaccharomyces pombe]
MVIDIVTNQFSNLQNIKIFTWKANFESIRINLQHMHLYHYEHIHLFTSSQSYMYHPNARFSYSPFCCFTDTLAYLRCEPYRGYRKCIYRKVKMPNLILRNPLVRYDVSPARYPTIGIRS